MPKLSKNTKMLYKVYKSNEPSFTRYINMIIDNFKYDVTLDDSIIKEIENLEEDYNNYLSEKSLFNELHKSLKKENSEYVCSLLRLNDKLDRAYNKSVKICNMIPDYKKMIILLNRFPFGFLFNK